MRKDLATDADTAPTAIPARPDAVDQAVRVEALEPAAISSGAAARNDS